MHKQIRPVSPLMRQLTRASCSRAQFCTPAGSGDCTLYMLNLHKCARNGRRNSRKQLGYAKLCRSRTGFSKLRRSARTHSSSHRCFRRRQTNRGIQRAHSQARSLVPSHSVSILATVVFREPDLFHQLQRMGVLLSQSVVQKVSGLGSVMIPDVRIALLYVTLLLIRLAAMRRVLHLKMVTQCAMLEDFGIFLVLADKVNCFLSAYLDDLIDPRLSVTIRVPHRSTCTHIPTEREHYTNTAEAQWLKRRAFLQCRQSRWADPRNLYEEKRGRSLFGCITYAHLTDHQLDSVFRVLEPVVGKINEKAKAPVFLSSRFGLRQPRSEWFRIYRVRISPHTARRGHQLYLTGLLPTIRVV